MKLRIGGFAPPQGDENAVALLLACHQRIRHFTSLSQKLSEAAGLPLEQIVDAAARTRRYFTEALPKHSADEEGSVAPRLLERNLSDEERAAVESMVRQHSEIDATLASLIGHWSELEERPGLLPQIAAELAQLTSKLQAQWDEHLGLEERLVFPAMARELSEAELAQVLSEMRRRRVPAA